MNTNVDIDKLLDFKTKEELTESLKTEISKIKKEMLAQGVPNPLVDLWIRAFMIGATVGCSLTIDGAVKDVTCMDILETINQTYEGTEKESCLNE